MRGGALLALLAGAFSVGCAYEWRHQIQWDSRDQIWLAEASQVKVRAAQSRVFDSSDKRGILEAVVNTFQDLGFQVEVLDEELGIPGQGIRLCCFKCKNNGLRHDTRGHSYL